ncbi:MAG: hypothetical protein E6Q33_02735 [Neisseriales bacterium]|nr:MAG: hypothetical protein E6Q33_02735 [Neisseriales bacterium]
MASETDILNGALIHIGEQTVLTADDTTNAGRKFIQIYPTARDALLRAHSWNFAITRASLAALADAPDWGYQYQYQLPSDCLKLVQVNDYALNINNGFYNQTTTSAYKLEGKKILTNFEAPLKIRYVQRVTDTSMFDDSFVEMLSIKIAMKLVEFLKNDSAMLDRLGQLHKEAKRDALKANAIEKAPTSQVDGDWIMSRL